MVPVDAIVAALRADPILDGMATGGIHDHDLRRSNGTLPLGSHGDIAPYLAVDDLGGGNDPFSPASGAFSDRVAIWAFGPQSQAVRDMIGRATVLLHRWQDPVTGTMLLLGERKGAEDTDTPDGGVLDRKIFKVTGIEDSVAW